ncbi:uncharacterized protein LOC115563248 [Drosophila navojoa]|uniref:uncharacterized protein LOC115563248 n=1 Tax=Drosophila navojoa TaxID=7232 RepID=UPI0011BD549A|nr:uncharacterized protein LOC115563248 [Drosophila navojoa]
MLKSYQLLLSIVLLFAFFNIGTNSFVRRANVTITSPVWKRYNNTRPYYGAYNGSRPIQPVQSSPQYAAPYQGAVQQPNIGFSNILFGSGAPIQSNTNYGINAQPYYRNSTTHGGFNYTKSAQANNTYPYARLFKFW